MLLPDLPVPTAHLPTLLSRPLSPRRDGLRLTVTAAELVNTDDDQLGLLLHVTVTTDRQPEPDRWQVTVPLGHRRATNPMLSSENPEAFVITCRANLEEWWDVKDQEPELAAWGTRQT